MSTPKRHHYLPQFYLKEFADPSDKVWLYDRETGKLWHTHVKDVCVETHYYSITKPDGSKDPSLEKIFSGMESKAKNVIDKLNKNEPITEEEKAELAMFIAFQFVRVPGFEHEINDNAEKIMKKMAEVAFCSEERAKIMLSKHKETNAKEHVEVTPKELVEFVKKDGYNIVFNREFSLAMSVKLSREFYDLFMQMNWVFLMAPKDKAFVTSDNPFMLLPPKNYKPGIYGVGLITEGAKKIIPLSSRVCLYMGDHGNNVLGYKVQLQDLKSINLNGAVNSTRYVIARDKALLEKIIKTTRLDQKSKK